MRPALWDILERMGLERIWLLIFAARIFRIPDCPVNSDGPYCGELLGYSW